jgi:SAM-dependent methyltransferase
MLDWMDVSCLSFNTLLLLERVQISWFPAWVGLPKSDLAVALRANPAVEWYLRHKCPEIEVWLDGIMQAAPAPQGGDRASPGGDSIQRAVSQQARAAEVAVLRSLMDLVVYVVAPTVYDAQPFLNWDSRELTSLADFSGSTIIDVGAGTGRLTLAVAPMARVVYAIEPVANLRGYLRQKARQMGLENVYVVDGLIKDIPFPAAFADVAMGGHVYGEDPGGEYRELARVTRAGGMVILCPGTRDEDSPTHDFLVAQGFAWSRFEEPRDGMHRKYWKRERGQTTRAR